MHTSIQCVWLGVMVCGWVGGCAHVRVWVFLFGLVKECVFEYCLLHGCPRGNVYLLSLSETPCFNPNVKRTLPEANLKSDTMKCT